MQTNEIRELLKSAESRVSDAAQLAEGTLSEELQLAVEEIQKCLNYISKDESDHCGQQTVLFVDDEELIRKIATQMLEADGYSVLTAADGEEGLEIFQAKKELISCVVLDLVMPGINGVQAADAIADLSPGTALILTSGYGEEEIRKRFGSLRRRVFIRKPFSAAILLEMVKRVISESSRR